MIRFPIIVRQVQGVDVTLSAVTRIASTARSIAGFSAIVWNGLWVNGASYTSASSTVETVSDWTLTLPQGKWYFEITPSGTNNSQGLLQIGIRDKGAGTDVTRYMGFRAYEWAFQLLYSVGIWKYNGGTNLQIASATAALSGGRIGIYYDSVAGTIGLIDGAGVDRGNIFTGVTLTNADVRMSNSSSGSTLSVSATLNALCAYQIPAGYAQLSEARLSITNTEVTAWRSRIISAGSFVSDSDVAALDTFVTSIKSVGLTDANSRINPFAGTSLTSALYPIFRGGGPDSDSAVNFVSGDYTRISGITGDGSSKYINTGLNASSVITPGSSGAPSHGLVYNRTVASSANTELGADDASGSSRLQMHIKYTNGNSYYDAYSFVGGGRTAASNPGDSLRLAGGIRSSASSSNIIVDGAVVGSTSTTSSGTAPATPVYVFALNTAGTPGFYSPRSLGGYSFGGVVPTNNATYATAWQTLMTAFGRQV